MSKYIVGDIHGCFKTFMALVNQIAVDGGSLADIVLVGDLIDRGPDSYKVVEYVRTNNIPCVLGNHEQMMLDYLTGDEYRDGVWQMNGGKETLASYDDYGPPDTHIKFLESLPLYLEYPELKTADGRYLVVSHSGVGTRWYSKDNPAYLFQLETHLLWNRDAHQDVPEIFNVHGHTPVFPVAVTNYYANIDTGCVFNRGQLSKLTCLKFPEMVVFQQENIETDGYYKHKG